MKRTVDIASLMEKEASDIISAVYEKSPGKWRKPSTPFCSNPASVVSSGNHPKSGLELFKYGQDYI